MLKHLFELKQELVLCNLVDRLKKPSTPENLSDENWRQELEKRKAFIMGLAKDSRSTDPVSVTDEDQNTIESWFAQEPELQRQVTTLLGNAWELLIGTSAIGSPFAYERKAIKLVPDHIRGSLTPELTDFQNAVDRYFQAVPENEQTAKHEAGILGNQLKWLNFPLNFSFQAFGELPKNALTSKEWRDLKVRAREEYKKIAKAKDLKTVKEIYSSLSEILELRNKYYSSLEKKVKRIISRGIHSPDEIIAKLKQTYISSPFDLTPLQATIGQFKEAYESCWSPSNSPIEEKRKEQHLESLYIALQTDIGKLLRSQRGNLVSSDGYSYFAVSNEPDFNGSNRAKLFDHFTKQIHLCAVFADAPSDINKENVIKVAQFAAPDRNNNCSGAIEDLLRKPVIITKKNGEKIDLAEFVKKTMASPGFIALYDPKLLPHNNTELDEVGKAYITQALVSNVTENKFLQHTLSYLLEQGVEGGLHLSLINALHIQGSGVFFNSFAFSTYLHVQDDHINVTYLANANVVLPNLKDLTITDLSGTTRPIIDPNVDKYGAIHSDLKPDVFLRVHFDVRKPIDSHPSHTLPHFVAEIATTKNRDGCAFQIVPHFLNNYSDITAENNDLLFYYRYQLCTFLNISHNKYARHLDESLWGLWGVLELFSEKNVLEDEAGPVGMLLRQKVYSGRSDWKGLAKELIDLSQAKCSSPRVDAGTKKRYEALLKIGQGLSLDLACLQLRDAHDQNVPEIFRALQAEKDFILSNDVSFDKDLPRRFYTRAQLLAEKGHGKETLSYAQDLLARCDELLKRTPNDAQIKVPSHQQLVLISQIAYGMLLQVALVQLKKNPEDGAHIRQVTALLNEASGFVTGKELLVDSGLQHLIILCKNMCDNANNALAQFTFLETQVGLLCDYTHTVADDLPEAIYNASQALSKEGGKFPQKTKDFVRSLFSRRDAKLTRIHEDAINSRRVKLRTDIISQIGYGVLLELALQQIKKAVNYQDYTGSTFDLKRALEQLIRSNNNEDKALLIELQKTLIEVYNFVAASEFTIKPRLLELMSDLKDFVSFNLPENQKESVTLFTNQVLQKARGEILILDKGDLEAAAQFLADDDSHWSRAVKEAHDNYSAVSVAARLNADKKPLVDEETAENRALINVTKFTTELTQSAGGITVESGANESFVLSADTLDRLKEITGYQDNLANQGVHKDASDELASVLKQNSQNELRIFDHLQRNVHQEGFKHLAAFYFRNYISKLKLRENIGSSIKPEHDINESDLLLYFSNRFEENLEKSFLKLTDVKKLSGTQNGQYRLQSQLVYTPKNSDTVPKPDAFVLSCEVLVTQLSSGEDLTHPNIKVEIKNPRIICNDPEFRANFAHAVINSSLTLHPNNAAYANDRHVAQQVLLPFKEIDQAGNIKLRKDYLLTHSINEIVSAVRLDPQFMLQEIRAQLEAHSNPDTIEKQIAFTKLFFAAVAVYVTYKDSENQEKVTALKNSLLDHLLRINLGTDVNDSANFRNYINSLFSSRVVAPPHHNTNDISAKKAVHFIELLNKFPGDIKFNTKPLAIEAAAAILKSCLDKVRSNLRNSNTNLLDSDLNFLIQKFDTLPFKQLNTVCHYDLLGDMLDTSIALFDFKNENMTAADIQNSINVYQKINKLKKTTSGYKLTEHHIKQQEVISKSLVKYAVKWLRSDNNKQISPDTKKALQLLVDLSLNRNALINNGEISFVTNDGISFARLLNIYDAPPAIVNPPAANLAAEIPVAVAAPVQAPAANPAVVNSDETNKARKTQEKLIHLALHTSRKGCRAQILGLLNTNNPGNNDQGQAAKTVQHTLGKDKVRSLLSNPDFVNNENLKPSEIADLLRPYPELIKEVLEGGGLLGNFPIFGGYQFNSVRRKLSPVEISSLLHSMYSYDAKVETPTILTPWQLTAIRLSNEHILRPSIWERTVETIFGEEIHSKFNNEDALQVLNDSFATIDLSRVITLPSVNAHSPAAIVRPRTISDDSKRIALALQLKGTEHTARTPSPTSANASPPLSPGRLKQATDDASAARKLATDAATVAVAPTPYPVLQKSVPPVQTPPEDINGASSKLNLTPTHT